MKGMWNEMGGEKVELRMGVGMLGWGSVLDVEGKGKVGVVRRCG